jgi:hypothetical protein
MCELLDLQTQRMNMYPEFRKKLFFESDIC